ncbi:hypothetical protein DY926_15840 [Komagataeibacter melaceti]|uniref:Uncharacterized protein n=1 Tax=Komagataeibacter melaceti TaxID=2766577 RepID=A0A371YWH9_9PROT|nr:hypothetical protein DY926_15840 [Komagataeibacter melaceti]
MRGRFADWENIAEHNELEVPPEDEGNISADTLKSKEAGALSAPFSDSSNAMAAFIQNVFKFRHKRISHAGPCIFTGERNTR